MGMRLRAALLLALCAAAALTGAEALSSIKRADSAALPVEVYAQFAARADSAEYYLRSEKGFVAVFGKTRPSTPLTVTGIEVASLRDADRAMLDKGIPVADKDQLLELLEDLGS